MSRENVEIVRGMFEAWARGDGATALASLDGEIEVDWGVGSDLDGRYRGHAALQKSMAAFWGQFEDMRFEIESIVPADSDVVAEVRFSGRGKRSGADVEMRVWHLWSLRDGKAVRWLVRLTKQEVLDAARLPH